MTKRRSSHRSAPQRKPKAAELSATENLALRGLKIGEAAKLIGVPPYVLRFWESQFPTLRVSHSRSKHRLYQPKDLEALRLIKRLLYHEGFTITGAKKRLKALGAEAQKVDSASQEEAASDATRIATQNEAETLKRALRAFERELIALRKLLQ